MQKGDILEKVEIIGISADGRAIGKKDGLVIFLKEVVPGDIVDIKLIGREKKLHRGIAVHFHKKSADRVDAFCEHFGTCGGCKWQNLSYEGQLKHKEIHVRDNLTKLSGMELPSFEPIMGSQKTSFYRNKLEFTFSNKKWLTREEMENGQESFQPGLGFHIPRMYDKILDIKKCHLQADPSNEIRNALRDFAIAEDLSFYNVKKHEGLLRNVIIRTTSTGQLMVIVQFGKGDSSQVDSVMKFLSERFPQITSLNYVINPKSNDTFYDLEVRCFAGKAYIEEEMEGLTFRIRPKSFYQTNSEQAYELYKIIREYASVSEKSLVYDLYTGTGTIANFVAKNAHRVVGIESVADAVEDAKLNANENGISNTDFFAGDMKDMLSEAFVKKNGRPDIVITDPPRAGMHKNVTEALVRIRPEKIVYVSCNPATQARDMELMKEFYSATKIQPVDMFPHTHHVENVVLLELNKN